MALQFLKKHYTSFYAQYHDLVELSDFTIPTWLALGAALHMLLPFYVATLPPVFWLAYRVIWSAFYANRIGNFTDVKAGGWTAKLSLDEPDNSRDGVVCFVLGARLNHPLGKLVPGVPEAGAAFEGMWREVEKNREKWSYLGRTATLVDTSDTKGTTTIWLSYWKNLEGLQAFASCAAHMVGRLGYERNQYPHIGIMHECFYAPPGHWECIYGDMPPWGLGALKVIGKGRDEENLVGTLVPNDMKSTLFSRMGPKSLRKPGVESLIGP